MGAQSNGAHIDTTRADTHVGPILRVYRRQLDTLRAVAVFLVIAVHTLPFTSRFVQWDSGAIGVRVFFVLSGFLISGILFDSLIHDRVQAIRSFLVRRSLRIWPLYFVAVAVILVGFPSTRDGVWYLVTYTTNLWVHVGDEWPGAATHLWSLAIEEQFYIVWPILLALVARRHWRIAVAGLVVLGFVSRVLSYNFSVTQMTVLATNYADFFGLGAALALWFRHSNPTLAVVRRIGVMAVVSGIVAIVIVEAGVSIETSQLVAQFLFPAHLLLSIGLVAIAFVGVDGALGQLFNIGPIQYLGRISYGLYVWHLPIAWIVERLLGIERSWLLLVVTTVLSIVVSAASWHFFEKRINSLKRHFPYVSEIDLTSSRSVQRAS